MSDVHRLPVLRMWQMWWQQQLMDGRGGSWEHGVWPMLVLGVWEFTDNDLAASWGWWVLEVTTHSMKQGVSQEVVVLTIQE